MRGRDIHPRDLALGDRRDQTVTESDLVTMRLLLLCCLWIIACDRVPDAMRAPRHTSTSKRAYAGALTSPLPDSVLKGITALEDSLARDSIGARAPMRLWTLGALTQTALGELPGTGPAGDYAKAHAVQYSYSEPDASFIYNGYHFAELAWRFPHDTLADHAGYALTNLGIVGECEGYVPCYIGRTLFPLREFLERFPDSPLARDAVRRANDAFDSTFAHAPAPKDSFDLWVLDSAAIRAEIAGYDSTVMVLPPALRALALPTIKRLQSQWGHPRRDNADAEPDGVEVDFRSARCGVAFKHPVSWDVAERSQSSAANSCEFDVQQRDKKRQIANNGDVNAYAVTVNVLVKGLTDVLRDSGFQRDSGRWFAAGYKGGKLPARAQAGAAWHGLRVIAMMGCYAKDGSHSNFCYLPVAFLGHETRSAHLIAGPESTAVFDLILRTISFP